MARAGVSGAIALCALFTAGTADATVYVAADLAELVTHAQSIVHGRVVAAEARWVAGRRAVETIVTVAVDEHLKGRFGETVSVRVPGGQMGPYRTVMVGAPVFREGEEVVLFLAARGPTIPHLVFLGQGVFRVTRDAATGEPAVVPALPAAAVGRGAPVPIVRGDPARRPTPLREFSARVRALAAEPHR